MTTASFKNICLKFSIPAILFLWSFLFLVHLRIYGVVINLEAEKYIYEAENLLKHQALSSPRFIFYSPTILIIYLSLKMDMGYYGAVGLQALYNIVALVLLYKSLILYFKSPLYPLLAVLLLIIFSPYSMWTVYLYTESLFYSNILFLITAIITHSVHKKASNALLILTALVLVILSRPLGILFLLPTVLYFFMQTDRKNSFLLLIALLFGMFGLLYISNVVFSNIGDVTSTLAASQECIICGIIPKHSSHLNLTNEGSEVFKLFYYVTHNFNHFVRLGSLKLSYFFSMTRTYYSWSHNAVILIFIIPMYFLDIVYLFSKKQKAFSSFFFFQITSILLFAITVMLQCDDYHNRFVLSLFPLFILMALTGLENVSINYRRKQQPKPPFPS